MVIVLKRGSSIIISSGRFNNSIHKIINNTSIIQKGTGIIHCYTLPKYNKS